MAESTQWEQAHFEEDELRNAVKEAKARYEDALREKFFGNLVSRNAVGRPCYPTQNRGSVGSSRPPVRTGAIRNASPVASSVSTATPLQASRRPSAGSNRPEGMPVVKRRSGSSFCMPMIES